MYISSVLNNFETSEVNERSDFMSNPTVVFTATTRKHWTHRNKFPSLHLRTCGEIKVEAT